MKPNKGQSAAKQPKNAKSVKRATDVRARKNASAPPKRA